MTQNVYKCIIISVYFVEKEFTIRNKKKHNADRNHNKIQSYASVVLHYIEL